MTVASGSRELVAGLMDGYVGTQHGDQRHRSGLRLMRFGGKRRRPDWMRSKPPIISSGWLTLASPDHFDGTWRVAHDGVGHASKQPALDSRPAM